MAEFSGTAPPTRESPQEIGPESLASPGSGEADLSLAGLKHGFFCARIATSENSPTKAAYEEVSAFDADVKHQFATKVIPYIHKRYVGYDDPWLTAFNEHSMESCAGGFSRSVMYSGQLTDLLYEAGYTQNPQFPYASPGTSLAHGIFGHSAITLAEFRSLASLKPRVASLSALPTTVPAR